MSNKFRTVYERQVALLAQMDAERLVNEQYTADAELLNINQPHVVSGTAALKEHFRNYLSTLGYIKLLSTDKYLENGDSLFFEATVETAGGIARVYDIFVLRDGRIWRHFSGLLGFTPRG